MSPNLRDPLSGLSKLRCDLEPQGSPTHRAKHRNCFKFHDLSLKDDPEGGGRNLPQTRWARRRGSAPRLSPCCRCWADDSTGQFSAGRPADPACTPNQGTGWKKKGQGHTLSEHPKKHRAASQGCPPRRCCTGLVPCFKGSSGSNSSCLMTGLKGTVWGTFSHCWSPPALSSWSDMLHQVIRLRNHSLIHCNATSCIVRKPRLRSQWR